MRVLLDESLPRRLARLIPDHEVRTVAQMGWAGTRNGPLLRLASQEFDVFLTADQNLEFQQNLADLRLAVVVLIAATNRIESLRALVPNLLRVLPAAKPGQVLRIGV
jgi:predicted nuclease of predicted toxin-antitoxin system